MGYYVRFETKKICLRRDIPIEVRDFLENHIHGDMSYPNPDHKLFHSTSRWHSLFSKFEGLDSSYIHLRDDGYIELYINCDINYGYDEIELFVDWITPFIAGHKPKEYVGWYQGEGQDRKHNVYIERK